MKDILTVAKKEIKAWLSDKAILSQVILLPFVLVFGYAMLMSIMNTDNKTESADVNAYYINSPEYMTELLTESGLKKADYTELESIKREISEMECELLILFPEDFAFAEFGTQNLSDVEIWYNSNNSDSVKLFGTVSTVLDSFQPAIFTVNGNPDNTYNFGDENYEVRKVLGTIFPIFILMSVFMVCMNLAAESIAGDKERGFLNTMLITPIKRSSIAAGKSISVFTAAVIGGLSACIGMALSLPKLAEGLGVENISYSISEYALLFALTITAVFALGGILLIISTVAKDVKQATNVAPAFMMVLMIAGFLTAVEGIGAAVDKLGMINAVIPAWNTMMVMQDIIELDYSPAFAAVSCAANLIFTYVAVVITGRMFEDEKIVNG